LCIFPPGCHILFDAEEAARETRETHEGTGRHGGERLRAHQLVISFRAAELTGPTLLL
jgi:hypothetical protein